jgi:xanthine dehydrogenase accessory factor
MTIANDPFEQIAALRREGHSFAVATVVGRRAPVSAHLGDRAIVFADGRMEGFIGGACSREIVRQQALDAIRTRASRLVSIRPDASDAPGPTAEHVILPMTCVSEGAVDVYVEPFVPARRLVVAGATPVADALARVARSLNYEVVRVVDRLELQDVERDATAQGVKVVTLDAIETALSGSGSEGRRDDDVAAVVASQGHYDEEALEPILRAGVPYVGLVASRARGATVRAFLEERGVPGAGAVRHPAGLDLGARTAPEVALSILAEIVKARPSGARVEAPAVRTLPVVAAVPASAPGAAAPGGASAIDPVCGMTVALATARHTAEVAGTVYYFCCAGCRAKFLKDPAQYRVPVS